MHRRALLLGGGAALIAGSARAVSAPFGVTGVLTQGGWMMVRGDPHGPVELDGEVVGDAAADGIAVLGFDRDAPAQATVGVTVHGRLRRQRFEVAPVAYSVQRIDGLPPDQVEPSDPALLARIAAELRRKQAALASRIDADDFREGFAPPLDAPVKTSPFGPQRILNGVPKPPHYGVDLAAPEGTPIRAPAGGLVVLAEPDMHFEGGLTMIDHGQGLVSLYLHQSRMEVAAGRRVARGERIGAVGMKGRATGPHLCWRMTWRGRHMDPSLLLGAAAPA